MNTARSAPPTEIASWGLVGKAPSMRPVWEWWEVARRCREPLLILGETGTGKRTFCRALVAADSRWSRNERTIHLLGQSEDEQARSYGEAWGEAKRSNPDCVETRAIIFHEIQALIPPLQHRLAIALREHRANGGTRIIATSSADLVELVGAGTFSKELFWQLNILPIALPPLRRRVEDLPWIVESMLEWARSAGEPALQSVAPGALALMSRYPWPGNMHELNNVLRAAAWYGGEKVLEEADLPETIRDQAAGAPVTAALGAATCESLAREYVQQSLGEAEPASNELYDLIVKPIERELLEQILSACNHKQVRAAERLGMSRNTLHKKLKEFGLDKQVN